ncbi:acidic mammalian chitinase-like [Pectinophora gossypiella]|uniref:acidic mammalian chitinase-like n=1 Tax=Pectinophora gossypiella TaxID=13191 RepID=UPI00214F5B2C|nr:acidic mammalian chitinase-like [Pectinophora gossypiella]
MCSKVVLFSVLACFAAVATTASCSGVVVCYYGAWSIWRSSSGHYGVSDLPVDLCTHIVYSFIAPTAEGGIYFTDAEDTVNGKSNKMDDFVALKQNNSDLKLMVAMGGWTPASTNFTIVVNNDTLRATLINTMVSFVEEHDLDGVDLDWEYPAQRGGADSDKEQFVVLVKELKAALGSKLLTAAVAVTQSNIDLSYNVTELNKYLDYFHLMNYDYHGSWETVTGVVAPLYAQLTDAAGTNLNVNHSVYTWIENGASPSKLVLGLAAYGKTFTLTSLDNTSTGAPASGAGVAGPFVGEAGSYSYAEICSDQAANATAWSITEVTGNYVYANKDTFWVGYDNANTIYAKAQYAKEMGLAGIMYWAADLDDFNGLCGSTYPLIKAGISGYNA